MTYPTILFAVSIALVGALLLLDILRIADKKVLVCLSALMTLYQFVFCYILYILGSNVSVLGLDLYVDDLSFLIIVTICVVGLACTISSYRYLEIYDHHKESPLPYYGLMTLFIYSMTIIPMVRDWITFLFTWEIMTLSSYFLIIYEYYEEEARRVGWKYFVTMHVFNTSPLILAIALYYALVGHFYFAPITTSCGVIQLFFLIGFITKAGLFPMHFWLPEAHPIAPSPISGLLSGVMVELGAYGMLRVLQLSTYIPSYIPLIISILSTASIVLVLFMYGIQNDIKRLFAWSTIDNMGWMFLILLSYTLGINDAGRALGLYILCHGLIKAAAFLSAGGLIFVFNTRKLNELVGAVYSSRIMGWLTISSILFLEGVPPSSMFLCKLDVIKRVLTFNPWIGLMILIEWALAFIVFLHIIHRYLIAHGEPRALRTPPLSLFAPIIFLLLLSIIVYPIITILLG